MMYISLCSWLILLCIACAQFGTAVVLEKSLEEGMAVNGNQGKRSQEFEIYCYKGRLKHIIHMWETVQLQLSLQPDEYTLYDGHNPEDVRNKYEKERTTWNLNIFTKRQFIKLNPFNQTCIGIVSDKEYEIKLNRIRVDYWRILLCLWGFTVFLSAPSLSSNSLFYYLTGMSLGIFASVLIFVYFLSRLMPRKPVMYSFLAGGWTIGIYIVQMLWDNVRLIAVEYKSYVFYYILSTGIISFVVCYRYGPVSDPRSINLIRWALQAAAMAMIFLSSDFQEASMSLNFLLLIYYNLPRKGLRNIFFRITRWWFPPKPRLLSEDEYHQQGVIETEKALESLRGYCSSPECNQWRTVIKLKDPLRFAKFMEGSSHLQDEEILAFEYDPKVFHNSLLTDDSSSE
ncbi:nuclear envelope integral membrane protein-like [Rhodnius prolixus]|uniref:nuclear envelope integral membrane protein-like n=1 Tax=Rhodnius prolixus TaxID=13249 RepID=UPI003D18C579